MKKNIIVLIIIFIVVPFFADSLALAGDSDSTLNVKTKEQRYQEFKSKADKYQQNEYEEHEFASRREKENSDKEKWKKNNQCLNRLKNISNDDIRMIAYDSYRKAPDIFSDFDSHRGVITHRSPNTITDKDCIEQLGSPNQKESIQKELLEAQNCNKYLNSDFSGVLQHHYPGLVEHEDCIEQLGSPELIAALKSEKMALQDPSLSAFKAALAEQRSNRAKWREENRLRYENNSVK